MKANEKKVSRLRRAKRTRAKISELGVNRLVVNRSSQHIYAQVISPDGGKVVAAASTLEKDLRSGSTGNADSAKKVGELIAKRAIEAGVKEVAFDRSGYQYHGRVKALADSARESGLSF